MAHLPRDIKASRDLPQALAEGLERKERKDPKEAKLRNQRASKVRGESTLLVERVFIQPRQAHPPADGCH